MCKTISPFKVNNTYNLQVPVKQAKKAVKPTIANYALILLRMMQDLENGVTGGYVKQELVTASLGHTVFRKIKASSQDDAFTAFQFNKLIVWDASKKLWYPTARLREYIEFHFGVNSLVPLKGKTMFDDAVRHNESAHKAELRKYIEWKDDVFTLIE